MGLIKMAINSVSGKLSDSVREYFRCDGMTNEHFAKTATLVKRDGTTNNRTDNVISNGSVFDVAIGQAAVLVENGKVHDFVYADTNDLAGQYRYDTTVEPSLLGGGLKDLWPSIKAMGTRFTAGGQSLNTMHIIYINCKEITNNPFGVGDIGFRDGEFNMSLKAQAHGKYDLKIVNPVAFYENVLKDPNVDFKKNAGDGLAFISTLKKELGPKFQTALTAVSAKYRCPYDQLGAYNQDICDEMNSALKSRWLEERGIEMESLDITLNVDEESKARIAKFQDARAAGSDPSLLYAMDRMSINTARETAAGNDAGVMAGFMGMGMAGGMMGQPMDSTMYNQQMMGGQQQMQQQMQQPAYNSTQQMQPQQNIGAGGAQTVVASGTAVGSWKCACGTENTSKFCMNCGKPKPEAPAGWTCSCGTVNKGKFCMECGKPKPAGEPLYKCDKCGWEPADPKNPPKFCPQCGDPFNDSDIQK